MRTLLAAVAVLGASACGSGPRSDEIVVVDDVPYRADAVLSVYHPRDIRSGPVAVLLHGCCGDAADMAQLALALADRGVTVFNASWTTQSGGGGWPVSYEDAACALAHARATAVRYGGDASRVALVGWSDGALLAAVVALGGVGLPPDCRAGARGGPPPLVFGLSGFYGYTDVEVPPSGQARRFLGASDGAGRPGDPHRHVAGVAPVTTVLVAGRDDPLEDDARRWADVLAASGHEVSVHVLPGDHFDTIAPRTPTGATVVELIVTGLVDAP